MLELNQKLASDFSQERDKNLQISTAYLIQTLIYLKEQFKTTVT